MARYKKYTAIVLLCVIGFTLFLPITAEASMIGSAVGKIKDIGNMFEQAIAGLFEFIPRWISGLYERDGLKSLSDLVFATGLSETEKDALPWQPGQIPLIMDFYKGLSLAVMPIYVLLVAVSGFKFLSAAVNPTARVEAKDSVARLFYGILIILLAPYLVEILMKTSLFLTSAIGLAFSNIGNVGDLQVLGADILDSGNISTGSFLATTLMKIAFALFFLYFNILYIVRMVAISVMLVFTPIMAIWWVLNKDTTAVAIWLGELTSNAFMPVAHALVLCVILMLSDLKTMDEGGTWLHVLVMLYTLIPLTTSLRNSMQSIFTRAAGLSEEGVAGGVIGGLFGGIRGIARVGKATFGDGKAKQIFSGLSSGSASTSRLGIVAQSPTSGGVKMSTPNRQPVIGKSTPTSGYKTSNMSSGATYNTGTQTSARTSTGSNTPPAPPPSKAVDLNRSKATLYNPPSRNATTTRMATMTTAARAGNVAGTAVKLASIPAMMVTGVVPGGDKIVQTGTAIAHKAAVAGTTTAVAAGQVARAYTQNRDLSKSLQKVTGTPNKGQAVTRIASTALSSKPLQEAQQQYQIQRHYGAPKRMVIGARTNNIPAQYKVTEQKTGIKRPPVTSSNANNQQYQHWRDKFVTPKQIYVLNKYHGVYNTSHLNRGSASDIIGGKDTKYNKLY